MNQPEFSNVRKLPENLQALNHLAKNYWWSWAHDGAAVFRDLDSQLWNKTEQNPQRMLKEVDDLRLWQHACDPKFVERVKALNSQFEAYLEQKPQSFDNQMSGRRITPENPVAYFCAEYGVHNSLPFYSGGLGILAGDHLKSASDLRIPLVAVGLFYRFGYFRQRILSDGLQQESYLDALTQNLALEPVLDENGERIKITLQIRHRHVVAQAWRVAVGRVSLYLLDTNVGENEDIDRLITGHLYGGDRETRVVQEMLLGIGGVRLLRRLNIEPSVFHLNEGHSAFLTLELARETIEKQSQTSFADAIPLVREKCVFTTHTPISAGNDEFPPETLEKCFDDNYFAALNLTKADFFAFGRTDPENEHEWFGMTPLSLRMCRSANGVSEKHAEVSRLLWEKMYGVENAKDVPITFVTNGVHAPTWIAPLFKNNYFQILGPNWQEMLKNNVSWSQAIKKIPDEQIWETHNLLKSQLIAFIRERTRFSLERNDESSASAKNLFEPNALLIGFARRVAAYKRWNLLLADPERLLKLIDHAERPVQFVFAGKAHPQDRTAKAILQHLLRNREDSTFARRAVFLEDYDQEVARYLVTGVDVWMNVPRRPLEASGTSGEKAAMNGVLNFSILDGWWIEGYDGTNGFAINETGELSDNFDEAEIDAQDAQALYDTLENKIVPTFYERDETGLPRRWVEMMRHSIQTLTPQFSTDRMVTDYVQKIYL